jgi:hypothetical protein
VAIAAMMVFSTLRFWWLGWIDDHYIKPIFHFKYFGFEWVEVLPPDWMYALHVLMIVAALCVMVGLYFRVVSVFLLLSFTYTELIDLTYYLNHYYFVSLVLLLLIFTPAHRYFSLDVLRTKQLQIKTSRAYIFIFQLLLGIVYFYAGLAKINYTWLFEALPLKIWLPANDKLPLIGSLLILKAIPYIFSWLGMLYDCTIVFWLLYHRTRPWAYLAVIVFHVLTGLLFQIGVFPLVMIAATLIFFSEQWHVRLLNSFLRRRQDTLEASDAYKPASKVLLISFAIFFFFQLIFPWRYVLYPGDVFWTEEGYRFSWRVMLMEKAGTATFYVKDSKTNREGVVVNSEFLNPHQEKQMAMQPDMIIQFAHFLKGHYQQHGVTNPSVRAEVYVTLNAKPSQLLVDPDLDLTSVRDTWKPKPWILPAPR